MYSPFKKTVDYYINRGSHVFACFIDISKAFDSVNYWKLFNFLLDDNVDGSIVALDTSGANTFHYMKQMFELKKNGRMCGAVKGFFTQVVQLQYQLGKRWIERWIYQFQGVVCEGAAQDVFNLGGAKIWQRRRRDLTKVKQRFDKNV